MMEAHVKAAGAHGPTAALHATGIAGTAPEPTGTYCEHIVSTHGRLLDKLLRGLEVLPNPLVDTIAPSPGPSQYFRRSQDPSPVAQNREREGLAICVPTVGTSNGA